MRKRRTSKYYVYIKPSRKAIQAIKDTVRAKTYRSTRHESLGQLITSLNQVLAGWANYFRYGVSKATFSAIDNFTWSRLMRVIGSQRQTFKRGQARQTRTTSASDRSHSLPPPPARHRPGTHLCR